MQSVPLNIGKFALVTWIFFGLMSLGAKAEILDEQWLQLDSNHFTVYSSLNEEKSREIVLNLEAFRRATLALTNIHQAKPRVPTKIYLVEKSHLSDFNLSRRIAGYIQPGVDQNVIFVSHAPSFDGSTVIYHEYVHFLLRNHSAQRYPLWYDEGFAEYLASVKVTDKHFQVGQFAEHRRVSFSRGSWMNVRSVIKPIKMQTWSAQKVGQFYANAWLLVHFLNNHPDFKGQLSTGLNKYLQLENQGVDSIEAFETAFSIKVSRLNSMLKRYLRRGQFTAMQYDKALLLSGVDVAVNAMPRAKAALALSEYAAASNRNLAKQWLQEAKKDAGQQLRVELLERKLQVKSAQKSKVDELDWGAGAFSSEPTSLSDLTLQAGNIIDYLRVRKSSDSRLIALAKEYLLKAWKQDKEAPIVYFLYGQLHFIEGKEPDKAIDMLAEAEYFLPASLEIRLNLASALEWGKKKKEAYEKAESVANWTHEGSSSHNRAKSLMERIGSPEESVQ